MAEPFLAEIRMTSFNFPPKGWAFCDGQLLPINQNQALFSLLGTNYGGDGRVNFALPDLRGRTPIHVGSGHVLGQKGGEESHTLSVQEMPAHKHPVNATDAAAATSDPAGALLASPVFDVYKQPSDLASMSPQAATNTGAGQAHQNMQPFLVLSFVIALQGIFPSQN